MIPRKERQAAASLAGGAATPGRPVDGSSREPVAAATTGASDGPAAGWSDRTTTTTTTPSPWAVTAWLQR